MHQDPARRASLHPRPPRRIAGREDVIMKRNIEARGNRLSGKRIVRFPRNLAVKVVTVGIKVPPRDTNNRILPGAIDHLHVPHRRIAQKPTALLVKVEGQARGRYCGCRHRAADGRRGPDEVFAWWVRRSVGDEFVEILKL